MSRANFNYFNAYKQQADYAQEIALNLLSGLDKNELGERELLDSLHSMENDADAINHSIQERLVQDFTVPLDRGDMNELANALDDICDAIEEIAVKSYIWNIHMLPERGREMVKCLAQGTTEIVRAVGMLKDMNTQSAIIHECCVAAQTAESRCDQIYLESARKINEGSAPFEERLISIEILDVTENAMDAIENAAEAIESVIASNI